MSPDGAVQASVVPELGAIVSSLTIGGHELLYQQTFFWDRHAERTRGGLPLAFPVCGRLERNGVAGAYQYYGRIYHLKNHGFSMRVPWTVTECGREDEVVVRLTETDETLGIYPFAFEIVLRFRAEPSQFVVEQTYANTGDRPMPYYAGFRPYFLTPHAGRGKGTTMVDFRPVRQLVYNERLTDIITKTPPPSFPASVSDPAINETLTRVGEDKKATLAFPDGMTVHMLAEGVEDRNMFPYVQLYTVPEKPFFCIEPWMGFPNALNTVCGARWLTPGQSEHGVLRIWTSQDNM